MDSQSRNTNYRTGYASDNVYSRAGTALLNKISWAAILAGVLVSLVTMLVLNLLGIGIGFGAVNPVTEQSPFSGVGTGAIIWWILSNLIAIFVGGYTAARLSGIPIATISIFHGILSWCLYTLISFYLLTTAVGGIISGVGSAVSQTLSAAGSGISSVVGGSGKSGSSNTNASSSNQSQSGLSLDMNQVVNQVKQTLRQADDPALRPENIKDEAQSVVQNARQELNEGQLSDQEISSVIQQAVNKGGKLVDKVDKKDVVDAITARTNLSESAVNSTADAIVRNFNQAQQEVQQLQAQAAQQAEAAAAQTADIAASAAIWSSVALVLGAIVAAIGGRAGQPKNDFVATQQKQTAVTQ